MVQLDSWLCRGALLFTTCWFPWGDPPHTECRVGKCYAQLARDGVKTPL